MQQEQQKLRNQQKVRIQIQLKHWNRTPNNTSTDPESGSTRPFYEVSTGSGSTTLIIILYLYTTVYGLLRVRTVRTMITLKKT
jgi:hypothetical protein